MSVSKQTEAPASYSAPTSGLLSKLPSSWIPYAELMRLNKPVGTLNIYFPYLFGSLFAAIIHYESLTPHSVLSANAYLFLMAFTLRSAGCTWNDLADRDLDKHVARCRVRPLARGAVSPRDAYVFYAAQMLVWLGLLSRAGKPTMHYAFASVILGHLYPFAKRFTDYPQVMLGLALSSAVPVGCALQGVDPTALMMEDPDAAIGLACLCLSYFFWTVLHDVIYGLQDAQDDAKAGVKSMCLRFEGHTTALLINLAVAQVLCHVATGMIVHAGWLYYLATCVDIGLFLLYMIWSLDVKNPQACWWWFRFGCLVIGFMISLGLGGEYLWRLSSLHHS